MSKTLKEALEEANRRSRVVYVGHLGDRDSPFEIDTDTMDDDELDEYLRDRYPDWM